MLKINDKKKHVHGRMSSIQFLLKTHIHFCISEKKITLLKHIVATVKRSF